MVSLQHLVRIITVAQQSSYRYRMNACVEATSVHTTAMLHHFQRTWWKKYTLKISLCNYSHIYWFSRTTAAVTGVHCIPCAMMITDVHCIVPLWSLLSTAKSCAMMVTAVQCRPLILYHVGHWCPLQIFTLWCGRHQCTFCNVETHKFLLHCHVPTGGVKSKGTEV